jgi:hypothetical protein
MRPPAGDTDQVIVKRSCAKSFGEQARTSPVFAGELEGFWFLVINIDLGYLALSLVHMGTGPVN